MSLATATQARAHAEALFAELEPRLCNPARARYAVARSLLADLWDEDLELQGAGLLESSEPRTELAREAWERCAANALMSMDWLGDQRVRFQWLDGMPRADDVSRATYHRPASVDWSDRERPASVAAVVSFVGDIEAIESARQLLRPIIERPWDETLLSTPSSKLLRVRVDRAGIESTTTLTSERLVEHLSDDAWALLNSARVYPTDCRVAARHLCVLEAVLEAEFDPAIAVTLQCVRALRAVFSLGLLVEHGYFSKRPGTFARIVVPTL